MMEGCSGLGEAVSEGVTSGKRLSGFGERRPQRMIPAVSTTMRTIRIIYTVDFFMLSPLYRHPGSQYTNYCPGDCRIRLVLSTIVFDYIITTGK
jgi:hypothetical protein